MNNITKSAKALSFRFEHIRLPFDKQISVHSQKSWELSCVITGRGVRLISDNTSRFAEGDLVLIPPGIEHCWHFDEDVSDAEGNIENISIFFESEFLTILASSFGEFEEPVRRLLSIKDAYVFTGNARARLYERILEMKSKAPAERLLCLMDILLFIADDKTADKIADVRMNDRAKVRMAQVVGYVSCNFARHITLDDVSSHVGMNRTAFCLFFKQHSGMTFGEFLLEKRMSVARELLSGSDISVSDVAASVGIPDVPYFCRLFKHRFDQTATAFRNSFQDGYKSSNY